ncbi:MAG: hypothetical protein WC341_05560 [Bacteroidales bacterium]
MWPTDLIISYSWWNIIPVLATGLIFAGILYFFNKKNKLSRFLTVVLFITRFIVVSTIAFLLLSPFLKSRISHIENPIVIVGIDNSASILQTDDSAYYKNEFQSKLKNVLNKLGETVEVVPYLFGGEIKSGDTPDFLDGKSDYGAFFGFVKSAWSGENTGLILLVGDGNYNTGFDPVYTTQNLRIPIMAVALGDTTEKTDANIKEIRLNSTAFLDDLVPMEVTFEATRLMGQQLQLTAVGFGKTLYSQIFTIRSEHFTQTITIPVEAVKPGKQRIHIEIGPLQGEKNILNNARNVFLNVVEDKQKILLLAFSPHPDIAALNQSLKANKNFEVTTAYIQDFMENPSNYNLIILHQLPAKNKPVKALLDQIASANIPTLFILGNQSDITGFNNSFGGLSILSTADKTEEAFASVDPAFSLFAFSGDDQKEFNQFPPLTVPLGSYQVNPSSYLFSTQNIKGFASDIPLVLFYQNPERKTGAIVGEGIWRWRMYNFLKTGDFSTFNTFINKSVQYLIAKTDRRPFRVIAQDEFSIFDQVVLQATCYNASFEPVTTEEIPLTLTNESGERFQYLFSPNETGYTLDIGILPEGIYRYSSTVHCQGKQFTEAGEFVVSGISSEAMNTQANHRTLYHLATATNGSMIYPDQIDGIPTWVDQRNLKSSISYEEKLIELESLPLLFLLIVLLLSFEWFMRKYFGTY